MPMKKPEGGQDGNGKEGEGSGNDDEVCCAVCYKTADETDEKKLRKHGCATCTDGAWCICEECHNSLLSRDCPLCRSSYEALELFEFPVSADPPPLHEWAVIRTALRYSNVCVWKAATRSGSFMLAPADPESSGHAGCHVAMAGVNLSDHTFGMEQDGTSRFLFDSSLWERLEEDDNEQEDEYDKIEMISRDHAPQKLLEWIADAGETRAGGAGEEGNGCAGEKIGSCGGKGWSNCKLLTPLTLSRARDLMDRAQQEVATKMEEAQLGKTQKVADTASSAAGVLTEATTSGTGKAAGVQQHGDETKADEEDADGDAGAELRMAGSKRRRP